MSKSVVQKVQECVGPIIETLNLELVDVEYVKEGAQWYLRIYIDKDSGVDIDDCVAASRKISVVLDEVNPIPQSFTLEVSSPGIERPLKQKADFEKFKGEMVSVYTSEVYQGFTQFTGILQGMLEDKILLEYQGEKAAIPYHLVERAHITLALEF